MRSPRLARGARKFHPVKSTESDAGANILWDRGAQHGGILSCLLVRRDGRELSSHGLSDLVDHLVALEPGIDSGVEGINSPPCSHLFGKVCAHHLHGRLGLRSVGSKPPLDAGQILPVVLGGPVGPYVVDVEVEAFAECSIEVFAAALLRGADDNKHTGDAIGREGPGKIVIWVVTRHERNNLTESGLLAVRNGTHRLKGSKLLPFTPFPETCHDIWLKVSGVVVEIRLIGVLDTVPGDPASGSVAKEDVAEDEFFSTGMGEELDLRCRIDMASVGLGVADDTGPNLTEAAHTKHGAQEGGNLSLWWKASDPYARVQRVGHVLAPIFGVANGSSVRGTNTHFLGDNLFLE